MSKHNKITLLFPLAAAFALASPAVLAQSHGIGVGAGGHASAAAPARMPTSMPMQASAGMQAHAMQRAEPQKAAPAVPATPATPAVPASKADAGKATPAEPATPATPATPAQPAANEGNGKEGKKDWKALDTDGNGSLSVSEAASLDSLAKVFAQADADANGELTGEEYKVWWAANAGGKGGKR